MTYAINLNEALICDKLYIRNKQSGKKTCN